ncbi:MAG: FAD-binding oxidoreductase [Alphaproteobacteria bacterium]|nr:MAG: FAD-binding oxidoreductase [Alphaproteobacteria bacterium]
MFRTLEQHGWGRRPRVRGPVARPERLSQLRRVLSTSPGPAVGLRRSYGDAPLNAAGPVIAMERLDRVLDFDPAAAEIEAEAGIRLGELLAITLPHGLMPMVLPGTGFATLGGAIANDVHGKNHHRDGSFGQHVLAVQLMGPDGRLRRLTPERQPRLFRATLGGLGQTGVIVAARIRLMRVPGDGMAVRESRIEHISEYIDRLAESEAPFSVGWIDATATGARLGRGILEEAHPADAPVPAPARRRARVPLDAPAFTLSAPVVRLFNAAYYHRIPIEGRVRERPMDDFFFPLDRIHDWNRLYGRPGFYQFQCVVPEDAAREVIPALLTRIAEAGRASPLAVLKRMGPGRGGPMSFPMAGYTLALDLPARRGTEDFIRELHAMVQDAGGRIYLAKDALLTPERAHAMYPERAEFAEAANRADPEGVLMTDLVRRLRLREAPR